MGVAITSTFKPMTYDEIAKPLIEATKALNELEDTYASARDEAAKAMAYANQQTDPIAYNKLKLYAEDLTYEADLLLKRGLQSGSRTALMEMKRRYSNDIIPIETAVARRLELEKELRQALAKDQTLRFSVDYSNASLDDMVKNPARTYQSLSGKQIADSVSAMAANYAKAIMSSPEYSKVMGSQYWQIRALKGYTPEQIVLEATNDPSAPPELKALREVIHQAYKGNAAYDKAWADSFISQGMAGAIGSQVYDYKDNGEYISALERESNRIADKRADNKTSGLTVDDLMKIAAMGGTPQ